MNGMVSLVGAGPGDPDLLTRRAIQRLERADLVLYDALVSPEAVAIASGAQRFSVGKRAGRPSLRQDDINRLMIRAARRGKRVVRLKCGDPFVLGRGGEEAIALTAAGVPVEIVPGISTAVAAPALAGIPVTHRGMASAFLVVSGHDEAIIGPILDGIRPGAMTLVILMGLRSRGTIARLLASRTWPGSTPAAVLLDASLPRASTWIGTLSELSSAPLDAHPDAAGTIVIGPVVDLHAWTGQSSASFDLLDSALHIEDSYATRR